MLQCRVVHNNWAVVCGSGPHCVCLQGTYVPLILVNSRCKEAFACNDVLSEERTSA